MSTTKDMAKEMKPSLQDRFAPANRCFGCGPANEKGLRLTTSVLDGVPPVLVGDALRLEQALVNLCGNAVKFTFDGEVAVTVQRLDALPDGRSLLRFSVRDTGPGLSPEQVPALFTPFTQGDASTTREFGGTGLGLTISRQLATLMGGNIKVTSIKGKGSTFEVDIPVGLGDPDMLDDSGIIAMPPARALTGTRVLLAEDNEVNQWVAVRMLERLGCEVRVARNGAEAVEMVFNDRYDFVLMDCQMPLVDGYAATEQIRARERGSRRIPIVALTAHALAEDRTRCLQVGMDDFITKPVGLDDLRNVLERYVASS